MSDEVVLVPGAVVLVTGGGSGIGAATARACARRAVTVAIADRDGASADEVAAAIVADGGQAQSIECDVADDDAVAAAVHAAAALGPLRGLVTSAGIFHGPDLAPIEEVAVADFRRVLDVNLVGTFSAIHHAMPHLKRVGGAIVTIASVAAVRGNGFGSGYTASKGGVDALTRLVAVQGGPVGVRANCICPGGVDTPMTMGAFASDEAQAQARRSVPLGRWATADDVADVATFLLSSAARYVTGQTFPVDGGATVS